MHLESDLNFYITGPEKEKAVFYEEEVVDMPVDEVEDDQEDVNFNIHAEILADANEFLNTYDDAFIEDELKAKRRRENVLDIMNEIEAMIQLIGTSAIQGDMYYGKGKDVEKM